MIDTRTAPYGALLLRIALGLMFIAHGLLKLLVFGLPGAAEFFASLGLPGWLAYWVTFAELGAGLLLVLGLYVRQVACVMLIELLAVVAVHWPNGWVFDSKDGGWEYPAFLAVAAAVVALLGPGAHTLGSFRQRRPDVR